MPFKNPEDKLAWQRANRDKCENYRNKWLESPAGQAYLEKQKALREKQKQANAEKRLAKRLANVEIKRKERASKDRAYRYRQRVKAMAILANVCIACGMDDPDVLEFDHIEPILRRTAGVWSKDTCYEVIRHENPREIFQLLCANCHAKKTRANKEFLGNTPLKGTVKND
jgi:hypothetical protein